MAGASGRVRDEQRRIAVERYRVRFREMAHAGELPGVQKASW